MTPTEIFYTPHTDDETLGMAGSIVRAIEAGRRVICVLVTDNLPSTRGARLFPGANTASERRIEWAHAMECLGVHELQTWNLSEQLMIQLPFSVQAEIEQGMQTLHTMYSVVRHHTVWGTEDVHMDLGQGCLAHGLCANAASRFSRRNPDAQVTLHGVYVYSKLIEHREAPSILTLTDEQMAKKRAAMECYKAGPGRIGYGYKSVPELFDNASVDPREFLMEVA